MGKRIDETDLYGRLGHVSKEVMQKTAKHYGWDLRGHVHKCENCDMGKMRKKNVKKTTEKRSEKGGERLFLDISSVKGKSYGGSKFWILVVDDHTDYCWSFFVKKKSELKDKVVPLIKELKAKNGIEVKFIRCDNAGENNSLEEECKKEGLGVTFEYTAVNTPEHNGRVERKFATLYGRVRASLNGARVTKK